MLPLIPIIIGAGAGLLFGGSKKKYAQGGCVELNDGKKNEQLFTEIVDSLESDYEIPRYIAFEAVFDLDKRDINKKYLSQGKCPKEIAKMYFTGYIPSKIGWEGDGGSMYAKGGQLGLFQDVEEFEQGGVADIVGNKLLSRGFVKAKPKNSQRPAYQKGKYRFEIRTDERGIFVFEMKDSDPEKTLNYTSQNTVYSDINTMHELDIAIEKINGTYRGMEKLVGESAMYNGELIEIITRFYMSGELFYKAKYLDSLTLVTDNVPASEVF
jgi:hypothetical protein